MNDRRLGYILLGVASLSWGTNWPAMKLALTVIGPWTFRAACVLFGGLALLSICMVSNRPVKLPRRYWLPMLWITLFNVMGWHLFSAYGLLNVPAGRASLLSFGFPFLSAFLGVWLLHEKPSNKQWFGILMGLIAIVWLLSDDWNTVTASPTGSVYMVLAGFSLAIGSVEYRRLNIPLPSITLTAWMLLLGAVPLVAGACFFESSHLIHEGDYRAWPALWYSLIIAMVIGQFAWFESLQRLPAYLASAGLTPVPIIGLITSAWVLDETLDLSVIGPAVVMVLGVLLVASPQRKLFDR
jgi:drug/metabolite transporter (DMT)-like permease